MHLERQICSEITYDSTNYVEHTSRSLDYCSCIRL